MLKINKNSIFYIVCPANYASGGPEDLHQLGAELQNNGYLVFMHYLNYDEAKFPLPVHEEYLHFNIPYTNKVENNSENVLIFPETFCVFLWEKRYNKMIKIVWWLSVTNFFISLKTQQDFFKRKKNHFIKSLFKNPAIPSVENVKKSNALHLAHSYFSLDFLRQNNFNILGQVQDYMDDMFYEKEEIRSQKEDIIIYNGVKNGEFLEKIKSQSNNLNWLEMKNMTLREISDCMKKAKVYVDFGYHPGKEKMPREACLLDCCLIIGKEGSARFKEDMPIKNEYHFEKQDQYIPQIIKTIKDCLSNYNIKINDFSDYKNVLLKEKETFSSDVKRIFQ